MSRFVATCDPLKGGIHISQTTKGFPEDCRQLIEEYCLELVLTEDKKPLSICPIGDGRFVITTARRVSGSKAESRPHTVIQGFVMNADQQLSLHDFGEILLESGDGQFEDWKKEMKGYELCALSNILTEIIRLGKHIQLIVPEGRERFIQTLCYEVLPPELCNQLYTISNGDCARSDATILITKEILGRNPPKYISMTWEELLKQGRTIFPNKRQAEKKSLVDEGVETCLEYIADPFVPENKIYGLRKQMMRQPEEVFEEFQMKLRTAIETVEISDEELTDYVQIMCMAFENYKGITLEYAKPMLCIPYDMEGLMDFLRNRCRSKRERSKYMEQILKLQLECYNNVLTERQKQKIEQRCKRR